MSFQPVFGGGTVQTAAVSYRALALAASLTLAWPPYTLDPTTVAARTMDVTPSAAGLTVTLPPATQVSAGYDLLINNRGAYQFFLVNNAGTAVATINAGQSKYVQLTDNTTTGGVWNTVSFGVGTSAPDAGSLQGLGVGAIGASLYAKQPTIAFSAGNLIATTDRASVYVWTGGAGTQTLPLAAAVGTDFFYSVRNQGTGTLTLTASGSDLVDGSASITLQPTEAAEVHAGTGNWYTVGRGRSVQFSFTLLSKNVTGGTVTLTLTEASNTVQKYTGALTSNCSVVLPQIVQVYYVSNVTTGAFTLTFKTAAGGTPTTVTIPQNANAILFCDGSNVINTSTTVSGINSLSLAQGAVTAPSLNISGDPSTGLYQPATGQLALALGGVQQLLLQTGNLTVPGALTAATLSLSGLATAATAPTNASHLANKGYVDSAVAGGGGGPYLALAGGTMSGLLTSSAAEAMRIANNAAFISGYNTGNSVSTGFLQFNSGANVTLAAQGSAVSLALSTAGGGVTIDPLGQLGVNATPASGVPLRVQQAGFNDAGIEIQRFNSTTAGIVSYSRAGSAYTGLHIDASSYSFGVPAIGGNAFVINTSGALLDSLGLELGYKDLSYTSKTSSYQLTTADRGRCVLTSSAINFTVPANVFAAGHQVVMYNNGASPIGIAQGSGLSMRFGSGASLASGNRALASAGTATVWFIDAVTCQIYGDGLT